MVYYILKWFVPAMGDWIEIDRYSRLDQARGGHDLFIKGMRKNWTGELKMSLVEVVEQEVP